MSLFYPWFWCIYSFLVEHALQFYGNGELVLIKVLCGFLQVCCMNFYVFVQYIGIEIKGI